MFTDVGDGEMLACRNEAYFLIKSHGLLTSIAPEKSTLVLFNYREGGSKESRGETLPLEVGECCHSSQAELIGISEFFIPLEIKRSHTDKPLIHEGTKVKGELIIITLENTVIHCPIRPKHLMANRMSVYSFDS